MKLQNYLLVSILFLCVDMPWLLLGSKYSKAMIESIQHMPLTIRWAPSMVVYLALAYLVTIPTSTTDAFLLGSSVYAIYDFTNYATLSHYSLRFAIMDSIWGGILMSIVYNIVKSFDLN